MTRAATGGEVSVELAPHPRSGQVAREAVDSLSTSVDPETMAKVRLLVTELVVAVLAPAVDDALLLTVRLSEGVVRAELSAAEPGARLAPPARPRHFGLFLVNRIADRWSAADGVLWFEVDARPG
jgi:hypothetical protein